jgi:serine/threonine protein phosphatase PrpC
MMVAVRISQRSCTGARERNEDCVGVEHIGRHWCMVLSDGAGGHRDGALASRLVVDRILAGFRSRPPVDAPDLGELMLDAHDGVVAAQRSRGVTDRAAAMHATAVVLLLDTNRSQALWGHVGDSRLYLLRDRRVSALTRDDSVLQWMVSADPFELRNGDAFLLCSDGWWGSVADAEIERLRAEAATPDEWLDAMIACAMARADPRQDNFSAIGCWVGTKAS